MKEGISNNTNPINEEIDGSELAQKVLTDRVNEIENILQTSSSGDPETPESLKRIRDEIENISRSLSPENDAKRIQAELSRLHEAVGGQAIAPTQSSNPFTAEYFDQAEEEANSTEAVGKINRGADPAFVLENLPVHLQGKVWKEVNQEEVLANLSEAQRVELDRVLQTEENAADNGEETPKLGRDRLAKQKRNFRDFLKSVTDDLEKDQVDLFSRKLEAAKNSEELLGVVAEIRDVSQKKGASQTAKEESVSQFPDEDEDLEALRAQGKQLTEELARLREVKSENVPPRETKKPKEEGRVGIEKMLRGFEEKMEALFRKRSGKGDRDEGERRSKESSRLGRRIRTTKEGDVERYEIFEAGAWTSLEDEKRYRVEKGGKRGTAAWETDFSDFKDFKADEDEERERKTPTESFEDDLHAMFGAEGAAIQRGLRDAMVRYEEKVVRAVVDGGLRQEEVKNPREINQFTNAVIALAQGKQPSSVGKKLVITLIRRDADVFTLLRQLPETLNTWRREEDDQFIQDTLAILSRGGFMSRLLGPRINRVQITNALWYVLATDIRSEREVQIRLKTQLGGRIANALIRRIFAYARGTGEGSRHAEFLERAEFFGMTNAEVEAEIVRLRRELGRGGV
ncbi:hypothetical protein A3A38_02505 [Candidatus Kaiserbacteria bacterium RIFCSPLOWO2_01_FULL_53_17]|uniref:Uncharacterized protein n=1 Tax=Candidatus Kaiserbacteria bacterium RIFCSPLOWO2_01_FULL_53_17 TaxID=1798511 RepID=A0A1F6EFS3_9BACT|nr:MAG: hypothetical protein A3A38_02505 [Candidatus Kaiserbacteria bacterium RIFCSPLOWO2_01_FULL_53_17]